MPPPLPLENGRPSFKFKAVPPLVQEGIAVKGVLDGRTSAVKPTAAGQSHLDTETSSFWSLCRKKDDGSQSRQCDDSVRSEQRAVQPSTSFVSKDNLFQSYRMSNKGAQTILFKYDGS